MGKLYGDWEVIDQLPEGGQAFLYLVINSKTGEKGVVKRLKNIKRIERFKQEIDSIKDDPKGFFPKIFEANLTVEKPYFVMEYFPKGGLKEELIKGWNLENKIKFYYRIMLAVSWAHLQGVIHRDLKPENILVSNDETPKVSDFGICFVDDNGVRNTLEEEAVGSFKYMAPELEDGKSDLIGPHTDVYSLGKIAYWLFSDGNIYNREKHRAEEYDLALKNEAPWTNYFNDFLDRATAADVKKRIKDVPAMIVEYDDVRKSMQTGIRYLDYEVAQKCMFCKNGKYNIVANTISDPNDGLRVKNFGFENYVGSAWMIFVCENCGNTQLFRKDKAGKWGWKNH